MQTLAGAKWWVTAGSYVGFVDSISDFSWQELVPKLRLSRRLKFGYKE